MSTPTLDGQHVQNLDEVPICMTYQKVTPTPRIYINLFLE